MWVLITFSGTIVFGVTVAWVLWVLDTYPIVKAIFVCVTALIPILALIKCLMMLYEDWCRITGHETHNIGQFGTVFRTRKGKIQVVSPDETFAMESKDAHRTPIGIAAPVEDGYAQFVSQLERALGKPIEEVSLQTLSGLPTLEELRLPLSGNTTYDTQETFPQGTGNVNTTIDDAANMLLMEEEAAKTVRKHQEEELLKQRIGTMVSQGLSHRVISARLGLSGRKYAYYKELCESMGLTDR